MTFRQTVISLALLLLGVGVDASIAAGSRLRGRRRAAPFPRGPDGAAAPSTVARDPATASTPAHADVHAAIEDEAGYAEEDETKSAVAEAELSAASAITAAASAPPPSLDIRSNLESKQSAVVEDEISATSAITAAASAPSLSLDIRSNLESEQSAVVVDEISATSAIAAAASAPSLSLDMRINLETEPVSVPFSFIAPSRPYYSSSSEQKLFDAYKGVLAT